MTRWWAGLGNAEVVVECGGTRHRLVWESGGLTAPQHADAEGERTLAALGGARCTCIDTLDSWARHTDDLDVLLLASRGPGDELAAEDPQQQMFMAQMPRAGGPAAAVDPRDELSDLLRLGGGLPARLVATVAAGWADRSDEPASRARLHAALYGRVLFVLRVWLSEPDLKLKLDVTGPREDRRVAREGDTIHAALPFSWVAEVWARGFATIWNRFCLAAESDDGLRWTLTTVGSELGPPRPLVLEVPAAT